MSDQNSPTKRSCELAAQAWCHPRCSETVMDVDLASAFAEILDRELAGRDALLAACEDALATGERDMQHILDNGRLRDVLLAAIAKARGA